MAIMDAGDRSPAEEKEARRAIVQAAMTNTQLEGGGIDADTLSALERWVCGQLSDDHLVSSVLDRFRTSSPGA